MLEKQMESMQSALKEMVALQRQSIGPTSNQNLSQLEDAVSRAPQPEGLTSPVSRLHLESG
jgi:hypothetical protein